MALLQVSQLWKEVVTRVAEDYPEVELSHMYIDNAAMQLIRNPKYFDTIVTGNIFGDILSDEASMLTGSLGMLPSASISEPGKPGIYEPVRERGPCARWPSHACSPSQACALPPTQPSRPTTACRCRCTAPRPTLRARTRPTRWPWC